MTSRLSAGEIFWRGNIPRLLLSLFEKGVLVQCVSTDTNGWQQVCLDYAKETQIFEIELGMTSTGGLDHPFLKSICDDYGYDLKLMASRLILKPRAKK
jgi:hypothetical protein